YEAERAATPEPARARSFVRVHAVGRAGGPGGRAAGAPAGAAPRARAERSRGGRGARWRSDPARAVTGASRVRCPSDDSPDQVPAWRLPRDFATDHRRERFCRLTLFACFPRAVRVPFGSLLIVLFLRAAPA